MTTREFSPLPEQIDRLVELGVPALAGLSEGEFRSVGAGLDGSGMERPLVVVGPALVPARELAPLLSLPGRSGEQLPGFVVEDVTDLEEFAAISSVTVPEGPLYLVEAVERGDELRNWSPEEALPEIEGRGRTPLTIHEGISWLLQEPEALEANSCFMTIGSRKPKLTPAGKVRGLDARTPALWISGGTGRDGRERKGAPKVGWCWARNRHTWLGFASAASRR